MPPTSEDTLLGNELRLQMGDGNSPEVFTDFCSANDVSGIGESKPQVDVTTLCDLVRKFRAGLAEGIEATITANFIQGATDIRALFASYKADDIVNFRLTVVGSMPAEYFAFSAAVLSWTITPPSGDKVTMAFTIKISGEIDWVYT